MSLPQHLFYWVILPNLFLWAWVWLVPTFVVHVERIHAGALGVALPGVILLRRGTDEKVLRHEIQHVRQLLRYSPFGASLLLAWHYTSHPVPTPERALAWILAPLAQQSLGDRGKSSDARVRPAAQALGRG